MTDLRGGGVDFATSVGHDRRTEENRPARGIKPRPMVAPAAPDGRRAGGRDERWRTNERDQRSASNGRDPRSASNERDQRSASNGRDQRSRLCESWALTLKVMEVWHG